jgi:enoyl-CoA hydratase/carnithine racemase
MMVGVDISEGIAVVTLNRPERANAMSAAMVDELAEALDASIAIDSVHTLVLTSSGEHFCTGFDIDGLDAVDDGDLLLRLIRLENVIAMLWHAPVQTVCFAPGRSWGAGADLLVACDRRVVTPDASIRFPGAQFGVVLGTRRLAERTGSCAAQQIVAHGLTLDAEAAARIRLVDDVQRHDAIGAVLNESRPPCVSRETLASLRAAMRPDRSDGDLLALVRSASRPGLRDRIAKYRDRLRQERSRTATG